jgi:hypothetical protein
MLDPILNARLDALMAYLEPMAPPDRARPWEPDLHLELLEVDKEAWNAVIWEITREARSRTKKIQQMQEKLKTPVADAAESAAIRSQAWAQYSDLYAQSQKIFSECLEFLGGLAVRDRLMEKQEEGRRIDKSLCQVADELIGSCAEDVSRKPSVTIPAAAETPGVTMSRIIRRRYPEWTVWTLPATAHEYGHVVIEVEEDPRDTFQDFVDDEVQELAEQDLRSQPLPAGEEERVLHRLEDRHRLHLHELLADAFATYTMGPAYACAAFVLRLNPLITADEERPGDAERAAVVLGMLTKMNAQAAPPRKPERGPYWQLIDYLASAWGGDLAKDTKNRLPFVEAIWAQFESVFYRGSALYPPASSAGGWSVASRWARDWAQKLLDNSPLRTPEVSESSTLRDALNAAWLCRIWIMDPSGTDDMPEVQNPPGEQLQETWLRQIVEAALDLCNSIYEKRMEYRRKTGGMTGVGQATPSNLPAQQTKAGDRP